MCVLCVFDCVNMCMSLHFADINVKERVSSYKINQKFLLLDYKPIDVNIDCTEENGTCSMNAIVDYRLSDHLTAFEVEVYVSTRIFQLLFHYSFLFFINCLLFLLLFNSR